MTGTEMKALIGTRVHLPKRSLRFECIVLDVKNSYGRITIRLRPISGEGEDWVNASSVTAISSSPDAGAL
jgi:hypothetical protein